MSALTESYENGECPDCGLAISELHEDGSECENCGHVFYEQQPKSEPGVGVESSTDHD